MMKVAKLYTVPFHIGMRFLIMKLYEEKSYSV